MKKLIPLSVILLSFVFFSCKKDSAKPGEGLPVVTTLTISTITSTGATADSKVTSEGGTSVTARGVCWSVNANPELTENHTSDGTGAGAFSSNITSLLPNTTYHVRAYATNSAGTAYGDDVSFDTKGKIVYIAGNNENATNGSGATIWENGIATAIEPGSGTANDIFVDGSDVYVVGQQNLSGLWLPRIWKNGVGSFLSNPTEGGASSVSVSGSDVYVAGFEMNGTHTIPTYWKNGIATHLPNAGVDARASSVFISGSDVYISGHESYASRLWKNGVPVTLTNGSSNSQAYDVYVNGTDVYVAGRIYTTELVACVWKNGNPIHLTDGTFRARATSVFVSGTDVYAVGCENNGTYDVAKFWKNGVSLSLGDGTSDSYAYSVYVDGNDVYVAGYVFDGINENAKLWKNGIVTALSDGTYGASAHSVVVK